MSSQWNTRYTLIQRAKNADDKDAWNEFVKFYQGFIYYILRRMNIPENCLDDFVQEILVKLWSNLDKYSKGDVKFKSWLAKVIRNTAIDCIKKEKRYNRRQEVAVNLIETICDVPESELETMVEKEWRAHLSDLALTKVAKLYSKNSIEVFKMSMAGEAVKDISKTLSITESSVYTLKNRVKNSFIKEMYFLINELEF